MRAFQNQWSRKNLSSQCHYRLVCDVPVCPTSGCGLETFLNMITQEISKFSESQDQRLINDLAQNYTATWNSFKNSRARGAATGRTFEKWITDYLVSNGKNVEKGRVDFQFGTFQIDAIIPSKSDPEVFLEIKINSDRQHALMFAGLLNQMIKNDVRIGYISLYKHQGDVLNILNEWKNKFNNFNFFHIEDGWSKSMKDILSYA